MRGKIHEHETVLHVTNSTSGTNGRCVQFVRFLPLARRHGVLGVLGSNLEVHLHRLSLYRLATYLRSNATRFPLRKCARIYVVSLHAYFVLVQRTGLQWGFRQKQRDNLRLEVTSVTSWQWAYPSLHGEYSFSVSMKVNNALSDIFVTVMQTLFLSMKARLKSLGSLPITMYILSVVISGALREWLTYEDIYWHIFQVFSCFLHRKGSNLTKQFAHWHIVLVASRLQFWIDSNHLSNSNVSCLLWNRIFSQLCKPRRSATK